MIKDNCFKVNEYITLKLEDGQSNIYIQGDFFYMCKKLLFTIPPNKITTYNNIDSIDEATEFYNSEETKLEITLTPEQEFWAFCSNLQVWDENEYDTKLLHSNLSFPLLKELVESNDPKAKKVFKDELIKRFESRYPPVIKFLAGENFLQYLNKEECLTVFQIWIEKANDQRDLIILNGFAKVGILRAKEMLEEELLKFHSNLETMENWKVEVLLEEEFEEEDLFFFMHLAELDYRYAKHIVRRFRNVLEEYVKNTMHPLFVLSKSYVEDLLEYFPDD